LEQKLLPFGIKTLLFGGLSPPNKRAFLCVLCVSAVKIPFWTGMKFPEKC
jgi:hypothetical protein